MTITLATLPEATNQQVFDKVASHLLTQNEKSLTDDENACLYHSESGLMCAAGCLISVDEYSDDIEGQRWFDLVDDEEKNFPIAHMDLIRDLQKVHDGKNPDEWAICLFEIAEDNNLNPEVVKNFLTTVGE